MVTRAVTGSQEQAEGSSPKAESDPQRAPERRRLPVGAEVLPNGGVSFRVWAPASRAVTVRFEPERGRGDLPAKAPLQSEPHGYFSGTVQGASAGMRYWLELEHGKFPDPASRFQPDGPHGPSEIIDPAGFQWTAREWKGVSARGQVLYELHVGTFTPEGSWAAAAEELPRLAELGITVLEVMPVADFPGRFGWGYDGVDLFAPTRLYGRPDDFRRFVDKAHRLGMGVLLDVVYNHIGPDGNYLKEFSPDYFTGRYKNEWGEAINYDGPNSDPVREFFISNAGYWIAEYQLDGLRLDATQQMFDASPDHVIAAIARRVRETARSRTTYLVAENEPQDSRLIRPPAEGGCGLDALWNDDFHHVTMVTLTGRAEAYYSDYSGTPQEYISALKWGFLFQGQRYRWQKQRRGSVSFGIEPWGFVSYIQNHDQVANSLRGLRMHQGTSAALYRAMTGLLLLGPGTPMLFQGQEFAASTPFLYFADHKPELAGLVAEGRKEFLSQFPSLASSEAERLLANPQAEDTFHRCKLRPEDRNGNREAWALHRDLLRLRREVDPIREARIGGYDGAVLGPEAFVIRFFGRRQDDRLLLVNFGSDLRLDAVPEPLLAPLQGRRWRVEWSSEAYDYGGCGICEPEMEENWLIPGATTVLLRQEVNKSPNGKDHPKNQPGQG